jgi:hypothetical protein
LSNVSFWTFRYSGAFKTCCERLTGSEIWGMAPNYWSSHHLTRAVLEFTCIRNSLFHLLPNRPQSQTKIRIHLRWSKYSSACAAIQASTVSS